MSIIDAQDLARHMDISNTDDTGSLKLAAAAACKGVQSWCGRSFDVVTASTTATARYYHLSDVGVWIDDATEITSVAIDTADLATWATTLATSNYLATPYDGIGEDGTSGWPYTRIVARGGYRFVVSNLTVPAVKVTAKWGWSAVPDAVTEAALMIGAELYKAKGGSTEMYTADGQFIPIRRNALVRDALQGYRGWRAVPSVA